MIIYGYVKDFQVAGTGEWKIKVRIPNIHGPYLQREYQGQKVRNYTLDKDLPWYPSLLLPYKPNVDEVVALMPSHADSTDFVVIGLTGGQYANTYMEI